MDLKPGQVWVWIGAAALGVAGVSARGGDEPPAAGARSGTLAIQAVHGSKGSFAIAGSDVEVDVVLGSRVVKHVALKMDDRGVVMLGDVPLGDGFRPVARIKYSGVTYQEIGPVMDASSPSARMAVTVYDTTDEQPPWRVSMRHVMATPSANGFDVAETLVVENPSDRTWLGKEAGRDQKRAVVEIEIPERAQAVQLDSGFHGWCCTQLAGKRMTVQMPLMPGQTTFRYSYRLPVVAGGASLSVGSAAPIDHAVFFVPDDVGVTAAGGLAKGDAQDMGPVKMRMYTAASVAPWSTVGLEIHTLAARAGEDWTWIAGGGAAVLVLAAGSAAWWRRGRGLEGGRGGVPA